MTKEIVIKHSGRTFVRVFMTLFLGALVAGGVWTITAGLDSEKRGASLALPFVSIVFAYFAVRTIWPARFNSFLGNLSYSQRIVIYRVHQVILVLFVVTSILHFTHVEYYLAHGNPREMRDLFADLWETFLICAIAFADLTGITGNMWSPRRPPQPTTFDA
jgi:hypothetical protein